MSRPLGGYKDTHPTSTIQDAHLGVTIDYYFAGKRFSPKGTQVSLLLCTQVYDPQERLYERKTQQIVDRKAVKELIRSRLEDHLTALGIDPVQRKGLLRDWELDNSKCVIYDTNRFMKR